MELQLSATLIYKAAGRVKNNVAEMKIDRGNELAGSSIQSVLRILFSYLYTEEPINL